jgi:hypothetical protein
MSQLNEYIKMFQNNARLSLDDYSIEQLKYAMARYAIDATWDQEVVAEADLIKIKWETDFYRDTILGDKS